ncbi:MAG: protein kinase, partial [Myxococcales bacterium]|nr:protein kinase [Myxococcales bacterium]
MSAAHPATAEGERRIGPYRVVKLLAEGGMGVVYRAHDERTQEPVALKLVRVTNEGLLQSFRREIYALRSLDHPQIVRVVADGVHDGQPWYAMTLLQGRTLGDEIDARHARTPPPSKHGLLRSGATGATATAISFANTEPPPDEVASVDTVSARLSAPDPVEAMAIMRALCRPLAYVHGQGVVHRDLKPDNVLIRRDGVPVLVDFGLAQLFDADQSRAVLDVAGRVLGTPAYMAPEQIRGDLVDARADLYALGCLLYECLTGEPPFVGSPHEVLRNHLFDDPVPPSQMVSTIPPALDALVLQLLEKEPAQRFGFAEDVAAALAELGAPDLTHQPAPRPRSYLYRPALAGRGGTMVDLAGCLRLDDPDRGACVLLGGPSGVGKTRLAMELATQAARKGMTVVTAACQDLRDGEDAISVRAAPLHPFRPLLLAIADRCRAGGRALTDQLLGGQVPVLALYEPSLLDLPGQDPDARPPDLPPDAARLRLLDALAQVVLRFADDGAVFVLLDDLQWADELSLAFLSHLQARDFDRSPLVMLGTYRSDEMTPELEELLQRHHVHQRMVSALGRDAVLEMVGGMLALSDPPDALIDFLMEESSGNPFFIAEYLRAAIGERILHRTASGKWRIGASGDTPESLRSALPLPGGMVELMQRRFAQISSLAKALAEMAAVLGREVDGDVLLDAIVAVDGRASERSADGGSDRDALQELRRAGILEEGQRGKLRFVHDRLREYLYADLAAARKCSMHDAAATCIEARHGRGPDRALYYPALAHHFAMAQERDKTIEYLEKAGDHALVSSAPAEARRFYERALVVDDGRPASER